MRARSTRNRGKVLVRSEEQVHAAAQRLDFLADIAWNAKARNITALDVTKQIYYTDRILICSGTTDRHVKSICDRMEKAAIEKGFKPISIEGRDFGRWILMDFDTVIVHIFYEPIREFYELERLWADATPVVLELKVSPESELGEQGDFDDLENLEDED